MEPPSKPSTRTSGLRSPYTVSILTRAEQGTAAVRVPSTKIRSGIREALTQHHSRPGVVSVLITTDEEIRELNRTYRSIDQATDVLTFGLENLPANIPGANQLGDIVISLETARVQAAMRGVPLAQELTMLAIHGALHLVGLDDEDEESQREMNTAMNGVAQKLGLPENEQWTSLIYQDEARI